MPFVTNDHVFVHMPKTGGTWLGNYLRTTRQEFQQVGHGHGPLSQVEEIGDRQVIGIVRNPFTWYMSWFQHCLARGSRHQALGAYGGLNFPEVLHGATHLDQIQPDPQYPVVLWPVPERTEEELQSCGVGLWTWAIRYFFGDLSRVDHLLHTEDLRRGAEKALGEDIQEDQWPVKNTSHSRPHTHIENKGRLWTPDMVDWVLLADGDMMQRLGYTPFLRGTSEGRDKE